ncbi:DUF3604 domain-containing protein [Halieaceae bacterium IMCC14734]|uniref:DUF3604 domain-containing protein n=1 Tax=Candidatus Litorirhabdus singularis TaxID=2518993 RepID=A0ABT3TI33_9GAMM|nr:DUF3604 domain-containing protein [Candidatus Litorirhabdus singularis]MCX2981987.1 DUF3604 domain-containing protein [Candidatus Litorirhabdus singularis]
MARLLKILLALCVLLLLTAAAAAMYLRYEFENARNEAVTIEQYFARPALRSQYAAPTREPCRQVAPQRQAWFGALHIHTNASFDAAAFGVTLNADDAYAFARGAAREYRLQDDADDVEVPIVQLSRPLDFAAVTDHAGKLGERRICYDPMQPGYDALACKIFRGDLRLPLDDAMQPLMRLASQAIFSSYRSARVCGADGEDCREEAATAWQENQQATEHWYDRSADCSFTSFHGYEYTLAKDGANLHRNVIFGSASVPPAVISAQDMTQPEQLWQWLEQSCHQQGEACDVITIPHNSNWSSGRMWFPYSLQTHLSPEQQREFAALRQRMEPLAEIMQVKGDSECRNGLSTVYGAADELCDFEKLRPPTETIEDCGELMGSGNMRLVGCLSRFSYVRYALSAGLAEQEKLGVNPFRLGIIAATDNHNGTPTADSESNYMGANGPDREARHRLRGTVEVPGGIAKGSPVRYNPGGLAGIWAQQNTRQSLFTAMRNRETFGTSGPRIEPRFFGGWNVPETLCQDPAMISKAYAAGVPMGGELNGSALSNGAPQFVVSANQDPQGMPLQKIQVIKGWVDAQGTQQAVYEVAGNGANGASVSAADCTPQGSGFAQLCSVWRDPDFDPAQRAVYYARVVENPSCRWSTWQCNAMPAAARPTSCSDPEVPKFIQERAWTSPIWYNPAPNASAETKL